MWKNIYYAMIWIWALFGLIVYFQNMIYNANVFTPFWPVKTPTLVMWSFISWALVWFWLAKTIFSKNNYEYSWDDNKF